MTLEPIRVLVPILPPPNPCDPQAPMASECPDSWLTT
jgi:hypothetical protein